MQKRPGKSKAKITRANGNKEEKIRKLSFNTLDEVISAIHKDTEKYIEKGAINGFLDHTREVSANKYPWSQSAKEMGEIDLEKAWVDQVDARIHPIKEVRARKFQSVHYKSFNDLLAAIKEDTKEFEQKAAVNMFLDYMEKLYNEHSLTAEDIDGGGNLLEDYHLQELKKFANHK